MKEETALRKEKEAVCCYVHVHIIIQYIDTCIIHVHACIRGVIIIYQRVYLHVHVDNNSSGFVID